ncbi:MAG: hypothetical protein HY901_07400, partial [Deltaproteobacteria bacterium]|nr:hypothetical protein [Deltaproteobacteria bacterium]
MATRYQILDEPAPGPLATVAVNPIWPLLGAMMGGSWLAMPWFALNALALGSPTRGREILLALLGGLGGNLLVALLLLYAGEALGVTTAGVRYAIILPTLWKMGVAYALFIFSGIVIFNFF